MSLFNVCPSDMKLNAYSITPCVYLSFSMISHLSTMIKFVFITHFLSNHVLFKIITNYAIKMENTDYNMLVTAPNASQAHLFTSTFVPIRLRQREVADV